MGSGECGPSGEGGGGGLGAILSSRGLPPPRSGDGPTAEARRPALELGRTEGARCCIGWAARGGAGAADDGAASRCWFAGDGDGVSVTRKAGGVSFAASSASAVTSKGFLKYS